MTDRQTGTHLSDMKPSLAVLLVLVLVPVLTVLTVLGVPLPQRTNLDEQFAKVCCWSMWNCCIRKTFSQEQTQVKEMFVSDVYQGLLCLCRDI